MQPYCATASASSGAGSPESLCLYRRGRGGSISRCSHIVQRGAQLAVQGAARELKRDHDVQGLGFTSLSPDVLLQNSFDVLELCTCILVRFCKSQPEPDSQSPVTSGPRQSPGADLADDGVSARAQPDYVPPSGDVSALYCTEENRAIWDSSTGDSRRLRRSAGSISVPQDALGVLNSGSVEDRAGTVKALHVRCVPAVEMTPEVEVLAAYSLRCVLSHAASVLARAVSSWNWLSPFTFTEEPSRDIHPAHKELRHLVSLFQRCAPHTWFCDGVYDLVCAMPVHWVCLGLEIDRDRPNPSHCVCRIYAI